MKRPCNVEKPTYVIIINVGARRESLSFSRTFFSSIKKKPMSADVLGSTNNVLYTLKRLIENVKSSPFGQTVISSAFNPFKNTATGYKMTPVSSFLWRDRGENKAFFFPLLTSQAFVNTAAFSADSFYGQDLPIVDVFFSFQRRPLGSEPLDAATIGFAVTENSHFIKSLPMADARETFYFFFFFFNEWKAKSSPTHECTKIGPGLTCLFSFLIWAPGLPLNSRKGAFLYPLFEPERFLGYLMYWWPWNL